MWFALLTSIFMVFFLEIMMNDESSAKASRTPSSIPPIFSLRENKMRVSDGRETRRILIEHSSIAGNSHHKKKPLFFYHVLRVF